MASEFRLMCQAWGPVLPRVSGPAPTVGMFRLAQRTPQGGHLQVVKSELFPTPCTYRLPVRNVPVRDTVVLVKAENLSGKF